MKLEAVDGSRIAITVAGLEWTALRIPVVRTNDPRHPREPKRQFGRWRPAEFD
ncbi:hypothetical protein [Frondihabitans sp. PhB188]|uniref:hypothetical protein n=1 Tax=Frondihabitans sp. PhB188 TaxID=2485200 RepID=UPI0013155F31|nr:hypothetical protein [Frondihabitans sp. PhB188]